MKEIKLTQGQVALVDDDMFEELNQFKWYARKDRRTYYAERTERTDGKRICVQMHRMILKPQTGYDTDHIDGDGIHNWRDNLRYATPGQNAANLKKRSGTSSIFKGVYWNEREKKWRAMIGKDGIRFYLGGYENEIEAAHVYDNKAKELFKEFALTNF